MKRSRPPRPSTGSIRILIADDHALVRRGLAMLLDLEPDFSVVGEAANAKQALDLALQARPDVVLVDILMMPTDGIELVRRLHTVLPKTRIIIVSMHEDPALMKAAFTAGAVGYVVKRATESQLVDAIHAAIAGQRYVDPFFDEPV